jgi:peptidoglycan/xylan/chitin deacetylase (PgdA/CDA1 family)
MARRRLLLVAAGGLAVGVATVTGRGSGHLAASAQDETPHTGPTRQSAKATTSAKPTRAAEHASSKRPARTVDTVGGLPMYYVNDGPDVIALTIDDGPSPVYTPQVLSILDKYGITAAFSMVGENVTYYPSIAREVADAGHTIVNHTWNHANLMSMKRSKLPGEVDRATDAIQSATGQRPGMFRAPYGAWSPTLLDYCESEKLAPLDWSVDPKDWARPGVSKIVKAIMGTTKTGSIILEHDGGGDRSQTVAALKIVIPRLIDEGYMFTVP